jgi:DNA modification methylase
MEREMILRADARQIPLDDGCVQTVVTSPPYWGLRDYGVSGQIGLEPTPDEYMATMVGVFREVWRVLRDDGTVWLNLGDSYAGSWGAQSRPNGNDLKSNLEGGSVLHARQIFAHPKETCTGSLKKTPGLKPKDLCGIPWRVAFALQADGWYLRSDIVWAKPNPMPESVTDRPTRSHEYIFLLSKSERYFYDQEAIKEPGSEASKARINQPSFDSQNGGPKDYGNGSNRSARKMLVNLKDKQRGHSRKHAGFNDRWDSMSHEEQCSMMVNKRDVWNIACEPTPEAHFATFPQKLIEPCILAGSRTGDLVLDPFIGSGTVGKVAERFGRRWVGLELSENYIEIAKDRTAQCGLGI